MYLNPLTLKLKEMETIKEISIDVKHIATLAGHSGCVYAIDKGISEQTVFTGGSDRFIALWNLETLQAEKFAASLPATVYAICHIPEKKIIACRNNNRKYSHH